LFADPKDLTDPGRVTFSHALHLMPGLTVEDGKRPFRLSNLDGKERDRYGGVGKGPDDLVQLDCASCHQLDGGDRSLLSPARSAGAYMLPINNDNHCKACHPLKFDDAVSSGIVPHRLQPPQVRKYLEGVYLDQQMGAALPAADAHLVPRIRPDHPVDEAARATVLEKVAGAERRLFRGGQGCGKCHDVEKGDDELAPPIMIKPTAIPEVWFKRAKFSHVAHRAFNCRDCHARAYPDEDNASRVSSDVLIAGGPGGKLAGLALCQDCHAPATVDHGKPHGGARFDCAECHLYHNGDKPLQGIGAQSRDPERRDK
jgi:hypothetical protein